MESPMLTPRIVWNKKFTYDYWMESQRIPIHRGFLVSDLSKLELGWWEERKCMSAFIQLNGSEGVTSSRVTEIGPGEVTVPLKFSLDEVVYVISGRGVTTIRYENSTHTKTFEWREHS